MENFAAFALPALLCFLAVRILYRPARWLLGLAAHGLSGVICLWLLNTAGLALPINAATVLLSGFLGIPGTALVVLLEMM